MHTMECAAARWTARQHKRRRRGVLPRATPWSARQHVELRGSTGEDDKVFCRARHHGVRGSTGRWSILSRVAAYRGDMRWRLQIRNTPGTADTKNPHFLGRNERR